MVRLLLDAVLFGTERECGVCCMAVSGMACAALVGGHLGLAVHTGERERCLGNVQGYSDSMSTSGLQGNREKKRGTTSTSQVGRRQKEERRVVRQGWCAEGGVQGDDVPQRDVRGWPGE